MYIIRKKGSDAVMQKFIKLGYVASILGILLIVYGYYVSVSKYIRIAQTTKSFSFILYLVIITLFFYIFIILQSMIHEAGHLLFGLVCGYELISVRIGNLRIINDGNTKVISGGKFEQNGQCIMKPKDEGNRAHCLLYNLGGCILNLAVSSFLLVLVHKKVITAHLVPLYIFIIAGYYVFLVNAIPCIRNSTISDTLNCCLLLSNKDLLETMNIQLDIYCQLLNGRRPGEIDFKKFDLSVLNIYSFSPAITYYYCCLDKNDISKAKAVLNALRKSDAVFGKSQKNRLYYEDLYLKLIANDALDTYDIKKIEQLKKSHTIEDIRVLHAYYYFYEKNFDLAKLYEHSIQKVNPQFMAGLFEFHRDLILNPLRFKMTDYQHCH